MPKESQKNEKEEFHYRISRASSLNGGNVSFYSELEEEGKEIRQGYVQTAVWFYGEDRYRSGKLWDNAPAGEIKKRYPFCRYAEIFCATGGEYAGHGSSFLNRELFADPTDPTKGYRFEPLLEVCENILRQGIKPLLKLSSVPVALSDPEHFAGSVSFYTNMRPPEDYGKYYGYLRDVLNALAEKFGVEELRTWKWSGFTEMNDAQWFSAADGLPESTRDEAIRLYQCTVAALESVLGEGQADVGPHVVFDGVWRPEELFRRCVEEINPFTGKKGTTIRWIGISGYYLFPGDREKWGEYRLFETVRDMAERAGLHVPYAFLEGDVLRGMDGNPLLTLTFAAGPFGISKRARDFQLALDNNWDDFYSWAYTTNGGGGGIWQDGGAFSTANLEGAVHGLVNTERLAWKLYGTVRQGAARGGYTADEGNEPGAVIGYDRAEGKLYALVWNHNEDFYAETAENVRLCLAKLDPARVSSVKRTLVDGDHGDFWQTWWRERGKNAAYRQSVFDGTFPGCLTDEKDKAFWRENEARYEALSALPEAEEFPFERLSHRIVITDRIPHHAVVLYEISGVTPG